MLKFARKELKLPAENESKLEFKERKEKEKLSSWKEKKLHGQFAKDTDDIKTNESFNWLYKGELKRDTESLILAAQEQALNTNSVKARTYNLQENEINADCVVMRPRMLRTLLVVAKKLAQKEYKRRHDKVACFIHWLLCKKYDLEHTDKWYQHQPAPVVETKRYKLLWDFSIQIDRVIEHRRPDIIIVDWEEKECFTIAVAIPADQNIADKEWEKISKYSELKLEVIRLWNVKVKVIPIVVGALKS